MGRFSHVSGQLRETPLCLPPFRGEDHTGGAYLTGKNDRCVEVGGSPFNSRIRVPPPGRGRTGGGLQRRARRQ